MPGPGPARVPPPGSRRCSPTSSGPRTRRWCRARAPARSGPRSRPPCAAGDPLLIHRAPVYRTTARHPARPGRAGRRGGLQRSAGAARGARVGAVSAGRTSSTPGSASPTPTTRATVLAACRAAGVRTVVDDNYAVLRVPGVRGRAGRRRLLLLAVQAARPGGRRRRRRARRTWWSGCARDNYSGGGQVQGHQALDALRALTHVPVMWAVQSRVAAEVAGRLAAGEVPGVAEVRARQRAGPVSAGAPGPARSPARCRPPRHGTAPRRTRSAPTPVTRSPRSSTGCPARRWPTPPSSPTGPYGSTRCGPVRTS